MKNLSNFVSFFVMNLDPRNLLSGTAPKLQHHNTVTEIDRQYGSAHNVKKALLEGRTYEKEGIKKKKSRESQSFVELTILLKKL